MTRLSHLSALPLLLAGLSSPMHDALRRAGVPIAEFPASKTVAGGLETLDGRIVLFDSRMTRSRNDVKLALRYGLKTIDVAALLSHNLPVNCSTANPEAGLSQGSGRAAGVEFFRRLRTSVERCGGIWMRLGDYPFPYQSVQCPFPSESPLAADFAASLQIGGSVQQRYRAGLPIFQSDAVSGSALTAIDRMPLLWRTTAEEFIRWWAVRRQLSINVRNQKSTYEIEVGGDFDGFRPTVELWRGNHVASWPLARGTSVIEDQGIAFVSAHDRSPGGMTARRALPRRRHAQPVGSLEKESA